ncbi:MAG TPA: DUF1592 domain-containing protein [Polyangiaceae bacterium]
MARRPEQWLWWFASGVGTDRVLRRLAHKASRSSLPVLMLSIGCSGEVMDDGPPGHHGAGTGNGSSQAGVGNVGHPSAGAGGVTGSGGSTPGAGAPTVPGAGGPATGDPANIALIGKPIHSRFVRLTHEQWENSVRDLLRLDALPNLSSGFAPDTRTEVKFSNNERILLVNATLRGDYQRAAETLSERVARNSAALNKITGGGTDSAAFIKSFGRRAYRRPLTTDEEQRYQMLFAKGAEVFKSGNAFVDGAQLVIEAVLQSPHFVYRTELGTDGTPLSSYEVAAKLSLLLRNTAPDDALLTAAQSGEFDAPEKIVSKAQQMLEEPATQASFTRFHAELLGMTRYGSIDKDTTLFKNYTEELNAQFIAADEAFVNRIFTQGLGFRDLVTSTVGFVNGAIAPYYGVTANGSGMTEVDLGAQRPGFFTRLGFLAYNASRRDPDPIHRGVDINGRILCAAPPPPSGEVPQLPNPMPNQTNRERVNAHTGPGTCGESCHGLIINPVGFAFENFDAIGQYRTMDNGKPVDSSGAYAFIDGVKEFANGNELLQLIANSGQAHACYASQLVEFSLNRDVVESDRALVTALKTTSMAPNGSVKKLAMAVIGDASFRVRAGAQP